MHFLKKYTWRQGGALHRVARERVTRATSVE